MSEYDDLLDEDKGPTPEEGEVPYLESEEFKKKAVSVESFINASPPLAKESIRKELRKDMIREQAVAYGKALGEHEADSRQEIGERKEDRVKRAMAYAAWEWDGKPPSSEAQRKEFGVGETELTSSLERAMFGRLLSKEKKEVPKDKKRR